MVRVGGVRVRRGGNRRVRKNGQTMNQFVQVTQLKKTSYNTQSLKTEFIQTILIIHIPRFCTDFSSEPLKWLQCINILERCTLVTMQTLLSSPGQKGLDYTRWRWSAPSLVWPDQSVSYSLFMEAVSAWTKKNSASAQLLRSICVPSYPQAL